MPITRACPGGNPSLAVPSLTASSMASLVTESKIRKWTVQWVRQRTSWFSRYGWLRGHRDRPGPIRKVIGHNSRMAEKDPNRLKGSSCTATLDLEAKTLTFEHWGFGSSAELKSLSPVVVPLGAIRSVEFEKRWYGSWLYV